MALVTVLALGLGVSLVQTQLASASPGTAWAIAGSDASYVQGGTAPTLAGVATPSAGLSGSLSCRAYATSDTSYATRLTLNASLAVGTYNVHCTGTAASGYGTPTLTNGTLTVTAPTPWTITGTDASYTAGGSVPTLAGTASPSAGLSGSLTCRAYATSDTSYATSKTLNSSLVGGTYNIHCTGTAASGYASAATITDGTLTVTGLTPWTITGTDAAYTAGGTAPTLAGTASPTAGLSGSLTCRVYTTADTTYATPKTMNSSLAGGTYNIHCTGTAASGYASAATITDGTLTVTGLTPWAIAGTDASFNASGSAPTLTGVATPSAGLSGSLSCSAYTTADTSYATAKTLNSSLANGTYNIHCTGTAASGYASAPTITNGTLTVTGALTAWAITGTGAVYTKGGAVPTLTGTAAPSAGITGAPSCSAYTTADTTYATAVVLNSSLAAGTYNIHCTGTAASGYGTPTINNGTLTVMTYVAPFTCSPNFYQYATAGLFKLTTTPSFAFSAFTPSSPPTVSSLNSIGWNPDDNYIYGLSGSTMYRIASDGSITSIGATSGVTPSTTGGDFYRINGTAYMMSAASGTWTLTNPSTRVVSAMTDTGASWSAYDLTIIGNKAYGIDMASGGAATLYVGTITSDGTVAGTSVVVTTYAMTGVIGVANAVGASKTVNTSAEHFGAAYSDGDGNGYFYSNTGGDLFEVSRAQLISTTPVATWITNGGSSIVAPNDGASCATAASPTAPTMTTTASATSITTTGGAIAGTLTNTGAAGQNVLVDNLQFCYAKTALLLASAPTCVNSSPTTAAISSSSLALSVTLSGLDPGTQYFFRTKATNAAGSTGYGSTQNFTTLSAWTITANSKSYTVGGSVPTLDGVASPSGALSGSLTCYAYPLADTTFLSGARLTINSSLAVGDYLTHCTGTAAAGYSTAPTLVNGSLTVTSLQSWQITAAGGTYTIGGSVPTLSGGASPLAGLSGSLSCSLYTTADTTYTTAKTINSSLAAGTYVVHCTGTAAAGYAAPAINNGVFTVSLAPWAIASSNASYTNGLTVPTLTGVASPSGGLSGSLTCRAYLISDTGYATALVINAEMGAGSYAIHCTGTAAAGYSSSPTLTDGRLTVSTLTAWAITASSATYTQGGSVPTLSGSASPAGGLSGSLACFAYDLSDTGYVTAKTINASLAVGVYAVHCSGTAAVGYAPTPTMNDSTLTVSGKSWTIAALDANYTQGGGIPTLSGGATPGGGLSGSLTCAAYSTSDVTYQSPLVIDASLPVATYVIHCVGTPASTYAAIPTYTDAVLTVIAAAVQYTVTYAGNTADSGEASSATQTFTVGGSALVLPTVNTLLKAGYTFSGWSTSSGDSQGVGATALVGDYSPTASITLYAVWTLNPVADALTVSTMSWTYPRNLTVGQVLKLDEGTWSQTPDSISYVWLRNGSAIADATSLTYTVQLDDIGQNLTGSIRALSATEIQWSATVVSTPPVPTISGSAVVGQRLTVSTGSWTPSAIFTYVWMRDGSEITGATNTVYTLTSADLGAKITVEVTATEAGFATAVQTTAETSAVVLASFVTAPAPTISGSAIGGQRLSVVTGSWSPAPSFSFVWKRDGTEIVGANASGYTLTTADVDARITVDVTATRPGYTSVAQTTAQTDAVVSAVFAATPVPTISGSAVVGQRLSAVTGSWSPSASTFSYVWMRDGVPIAGATASTYVVTVTDMDARITVAVTAAKDGFTSVVKTSSQTDVVARASFVSTAVPTIVGSVAVGQRLTVSTGTWSPAAAFTYIWKRDGVAISGGVGAGYTVALADLNAKITVEVTGYRNGFIAVVQNTDETDSVAKGAFATPPVPTITGSTVVGQTLTANAGTWSPAAAFTYVWKRGGTSIGGATAGTYVLTAFDVDATITVEVTGSKAGYSGATSASAQTDAVVRAAFVTTPVPTISGTSISGAAVVGQRLTAVTGSWSPAAAFSYVWKRDGVAISGATASSYLLSVLDVDKKLSVEVTASKAGYTSVVQTTAETAAVVRDVFVSSEVPTISGSAVAGQRLTAATGSWSPAAAFSYVWKRDGVAIAGGVGAGYTMVGADIGAKITVEVTGYRTGYTSVVQTTAETSVVAPASFTTAPVPTISGSAVVGQRLTAVTGSWSPGPAFGYVWKRDGVAIAGAVGASYGIGAADLGKKITVEVTGYRTGYTSVVQTTAQTATVTR